MQPFFWPIWILLLFIIIYNHQPKKSETRAIIKNDSPKIGIFHTMDYYCLGFILHSKRKNRIRVKFIVSVWFLNRMSTEWNGNAYDRGSVIGSKWINNWSYLFNGIPGNWYFMNDEMNNGNCSSRSRCDTTLILRREKKINEIHSLIKTAPGN